MCGATGEVRLDNQAPEVAAVAAMAGNMARRGPDGSGVWSQGRVALGHRRLKIIDLSEAGAQPMVDAELGLTSAGTAASTTTRRCATSWPATATVLLAQRHRGAAEGLPPLGRPVRRAAARHVRLRHRRTRQRPRAARPRPAGHQAAVHQRGHPSDPLRLLVACPAGGWWCRHPDRPGGPAPLSDVPFRGSRTAHHPARRAQAAAGHALAIEADGTRTTTTYWSPDFTRRPIAPTGAKRIGRKRFSTRCVLL